jgi:DNA adenine methylase
VIYIGSKRRVRRRLLPHILRDRKPGQAYVEPFLGGANVIEIVPGAYRIGNDKNYYLMEMWRALQRGWEPPVRVSKDDFLRIKKNKEQFPPQLVGFVGFCCAAFGKWFGGYAHCDGINYARRSHDKLLRQIQQLRDVELHCKDYKELEYPENSIIYCDPPYANTTKYEEVDFDIDEFWAWAREMSRSHSMYVSSYEAPRDFEIVTEIETYCIVPGKSNKKTTERLFRHRR